VPFSLIIRNSACLSSSCSPRAQNLSRGPKSEIVGAKVGARISLQSRIWRTSTCASFSVSHCLACTTRTRAGWLPTRCTVERHDLWAITNQLLSETESAGIALNRRLQLRRVLFDVNTLLCAKVVDMHGEPASSSGQARSRRSAQVLSTTSVLIVLVEAPPYHCAPRRTGQGSLKQYGRRAGHRERPCHLVRLQLHASARVHAVHSI